MKFQRNLFFLMVTLAVCACKPTPEKPVRIYITEVESIPGEFGNISKGISASFAGLIDEKLIVAGGCNFPDTAAADGGKKYFTRTFFCLMVENGEKLVNFRAIWLMESQSVYPMGC